MFEMSTREMSGRRLVRSVLLGEAMESAANNLCRGSLERDLFQGGFLLENEWLFLGGIAFQGELLSRGIAFLW
jgi:hypothetical protein